MFRVCFWWDEVGATHYLDVCPYTCTHCPASLAGAYLTLLNTIANMGFILPRTPLFWLIDVLTVARCTGPDGMLRDAACPKKSRDFTGPNACMELGGSCSMDADGFYMIGWTCLALGGAIGLVYIKYLPALMALPLSRWRVRVD